MLGGVREHLPALLELLQRRENARAQRRVLNRIAHFYRKLSEQGPFLQYLSEQNLRILIVLDELGVQHAHVFLEHLLLAHERVNAARRDMVILCFTLPIISVFVGKKLIV